MELKIVPLGGLGEFGMNCTVMECGDDAIVIDAGLMFPDESAPGVDVIIPDFSYLFDSRDRIRAILLTHAHEDHAGALPYLLREIDAPVYGSALTMALIESKLSEHAVEASRRRVAVSARDIIAAGCFEIEFLQVSHSLADAMGMAIKTPAGNVVHSGDFKIDSTPFRGEGIDFQRLAQYSEQGVLALLSDSTNAEQPGYTPSESAILRRMDEIFAASTGRIFVTCFATGLSRIQQIVELAAKHGRRLAVLGRAMIEIFDICGRLGYLSVPQEMLVRREEIRQIPAGELVVLATGSQGEALSAMNRISMMDYRYVQVDAGDTVIISARIIPGNERSVSGVINRMVRRGARVFHEDVADVHVSGHASQEELKLLIRIVMPRYFIPIHGEFRQLYAHADLARQVGIPDENILIAETGDVVSLTPESAAITGKIDVGRVFIDVSGYGEVEETILADRKHLSADGFVVLVLAINKTDGSLRGAPEVIARGFLEFEDDGVLHDTQQVCATVISELPLEERQDWAAVKEKLRREVRRFLSKRTMKRPMIIPVIMEV
ncbi:MAG: ribonuclease J [Acidobacteriota bacterium]